MSTHLLRTLMPLAPFAQMPAGIYEELQCRSVFSWELNDAQSRAISIQGYCNDDPYLRSWSIEYMDDAADFLVSCNTHTPIVGIIAEVGNTHVQYLWVDQECSYPAANGSLTAGWTQVMYYLGTPTIIGSVPAPVFTGAAVASVTGGADLNDIFVFRAPPQVLGKGTEAEPFEIETTEQFHLLVYEYMPKYENGIGYGFFAQAHYKLINNIDLSAYPAWQSAPWFGGVFDGNGKTINNLNSASGLFTQLMATAHIFDLGITNAVIYNYNAGCFGGGLGNGAVIERCYGTGEVGTNQITSSFSTGGLVASMASGSIIQDCYFIGEIYARDVDASMGAFAGASSGIIRRCYAACYVLPQFSYGAGAPYAPFVGEQTGVLSGSYYNSDTTYRLSEYGNDRFVAQDTPLTTIQMQGNAPATNMAGLLNSGETWGDTWVLTEGFPELAAFQ